MKKVILFFLLAVVTGLTAGEVRLQWTDTSQAPRLALNTRVFEQLPGGVSLPPLTGTWRQIAAPNCTSDTDPVKPGRQNTFTVYNVAIGSHTYAVVATNGGGDTAPSNAVTCTVIVPPPTAHTDLEATSVSL